MTNKTFKTAAAAFAAIAMTGFANAQDASFDSAAMMQTINADLDRQIAEFTLAVVNQADANVQSRLAKIENVFDPLVAPRDVDYTAALAETEEMVELAALSAAEFEISKASANIENPFEPRLPMAPAMIAIDDGQY